MGHRIADCPEPKKQRVVSNSVAIKNKPKENKPNARVFAITQEEVDNASDVVAGLRVEILSELYRVAMPTNKAIETHKLHQSCQVSIGNHTFEVDLIQLNMVEFDVILEIDWLAKNHALVDCYRKSVKLRTPSQEKIIYHDKANEKRFLLPTSQTLKAMRSGDGIYQL
ncbi:uncharacterized protein LOC122023179 [Zingiber officinale]|uniref:uncharacterized protein LOC122023179 n=1 Tax=Zingiber officinale TaxID=94328 RepID=UPI001C4B45A6|nr:uncharacterized protein LOC122023179 [Zingiber officinale]